MLLVRSEICHPSGRRISCVGVNELEQLCRTCDLRSLISEKALRASDSISALGLTDTEQRCDRRKIVADQNRILFDVLNPQDQEMDLEFLGKEGSAWTAFRPSMMSSAVWTSGIVCIAAVYQLKPGPFRGRWHDGVRIAVIGLRLTLPSENYGVAFDRTCRA